MVGDHDFETSRLCFRDLLDRGYPAVDREHEPDAVVGQSSQGRARDAVTLLEAARKVPDHVGAELTQVQNRERSGADPVHVVVPVDADALSRGDCGSDPLDRPGHVTEEKGIVTRELGVEEAPCELRIAIATPREHRRGDVAELQLTRERPRFLEVERSDRPDTGHRSDGTDGAGRLRLRVVVRIAALSTSDLVRHGDAEARPARS